MQIAEALVARDAENAVWQEDLAAGQTELARVLVDRGDPAAARPQLEAALARYRILARTDNAYDVNVAKVGTLLARILAQEGDAAAARVLLEEAIGLVREGAAGDPERASVLAEAQVARAALE